MKSQLAQEDRTDLIRRLRRLEGQVRGIQRMVEEERDCEEIMLQLAALRAAVYRVATHLVAANMERCVLMDTGEERKQKLRSLARALARF